LIAETRMYGEGRKHCQWLQWGRDQLIAETRHPTIMHGDGGAALQWGRDQLIAETSRHWCFWFHRKGLQWGRDQLIAETACLVVGFLLFVRASMGPRSIDRGNNFFVKGDER